MGSGSYRSPVRPAVVAPFVVCVGLAVVLAVGDGSAAATVVDDLVTTGLSTYATACAALAARSAVGQMRRAWAIMAVALGAWAAADLTWLISDYVLHIDPFPSPADVLYFAFTVLAIPALLAMAPFDPWSRAQARWRIFLDGVTAALCVFLLAWLLGLSDVVEAYQDDRMALAVALLYPTADIVLLAVAIAVLARAGTGQRTVLALLVAAFGIMAVTDSAFAYLVARDLYSAGSLIDVGWAVALAIVSAAALNSPRGAPSVSATLSVPSTTALWAPSLPLLLVGTVGPPLVVTGLVRYVAPLIVIGVCLRQFVAAWESRQWLTAGIEHSLRDPLTGLANSTLFEDRLTHAMTLRSRDERPVMVVSLDLDDFGFVNDSLGHLFADRLLVHAGQRIAASVRPGDTVARIGGDEFALILEGDVQDAQRVLQQVVDTFEEPFEVDGQQVSIRCSVGVAVVFADERDVTPATMLKRADVAMRSAKNAAFPRIRFFRDDMPESDTDTGGLRTDRVAVNGAAKVRMLGDLRRAVDRGDLELAYQPKVDLRGGQVVGVEALLRWPHPQLGILQPGAFMPLVRDHRLIRPVTDLVIDKVLDSAAGWAADGAQVSVAVNLFAPSLRDATLPARLRDALDRRGLPAQLLTIEITEDLVISDLDLVTTVLRELREHGMQVAIDDFGSGYSALAYLKDLSIDEIKLDRTFIGTVITDPRAAVVVRAIIELTHGLGMTVVAEGIEDAATAEWLRDSGCDVGQGFYFGRPRDAEDIPDLCRSAISPP